MVRKVSLILTVFLSGCGDFAQPRTESEIRSIAAEAPRVDIVRLQMQVIDLQTDIRELKQRNELEAMSRSSQYQKPAIHDTNKDRQK